MGHGLALERGFFPAVPVPLWADGSLDEASQKRYVSYMHSQAPTGVAVWAHTGRGLALSRSQREYVLKSWRDGLPEGLIIAGAGGSTDDEAMRMAEDAAAWGADCSSAATAVAPRLETHTHTSAPAGSRTAKKPRRPIAFHVKSLHRLPS